MKCSFNPFLVLDDGGNFKKGGNYDVRVSGYQILNIDTYVPVIVKGKGCVGLAEIKTLLFSKDTTSVRFNFYNISSEAEAKAYYNLYRNSVGGEMDYEDGQDAVIPGIAGGRKRSTSSIFDDDDDDDSKDSFYRGPKPTSRFPW